MNLFRSLLHNIGVVIVGLGVAFLGAGLDFLFGIDGFQSLPTTAAAWLLLTVGFLLRVWAAPPPDFQYVAVLGNSGNGFWCTLFKGTWPIVLFSP